VSSLTGKQIRLKRIFNEKSGNLVLVPLDHGMTMGPIDGIKNIKETMKNFIYSHVDGVVLHKGNVTEASDYIGRDISLFVHLSASTEISPDPNLKTLICTVEEGLQLGAEGVSIQVNLGSDNESRMLYDFGVVAKKCADWGMPLLAMVYTRGKNISGSVVENTKLAARVACELGADIVKVGFTGDTDSFGRVVEGCSIPIVVAGGEKAKNTESALRGVVMAMEAGARGVACGRNVFQHENPEAFCKAVSAIVHDKASVEEALEIMNLQVPIRQVI